MSGAVSCFLNPFFPILSNGGVDKGLSPVKVQLDAWEDKNGRMSKLNLFGCRKELTGD